ncbi:hypothetical protein GGS23DRAFT_24688 [Durotheca rogersii]|uniref:uncharacterized protein n=1 Tax=Durotheca rogersii TaxID=419775 RepID=UPI00221FA676|nr:uncharacterized protein GGS23DRAFT_24688 [Durotheca rogersii]KAI5868367.1 hypothetical protein GGS23DRAFT_24688 [Durotheca rogersii]
MSSLPPRSDLFHGRIADRILLPRHPKQGLLARSLILLTPLTYRRHHCGHNPYACMGLPLLFFSSTMPCLPAAWAAPSRVSGNGGDSGSQRHAIQRSRLCLNAPSTSHEGLLPEVHAAIRPSFWCERGRGDVRESEKDRRGQRGRRRRLRQPRACDSLSGPHHLFPPPPPFQPCRVSRDQVPSWLISSG